jgi:hypothetical protein
LSIGSRRHAGGGSLGKVTASTDGRGLEVAAVVEIRAGGDAARLPGPEAGECEAAPARATPVL